MSENKVEVKSLTSYESAFKLWKVSFILIITLVIAISAYVVYTSNKRVTDLQDSIYVLSPTGEISVALRSSEKDNRIFEYESHVEKAYKLWYEIDEGSYQSNVDKALFLFGDCGKSMLNDYTEQGIFRKLQAKNMQLFADVDSVKFDQSVTPIFGIVYGKQKVTRPGGVLLRHMDCSFNIIDYSRSHENPHGVKLENWEIINSEIIE